MCYRCEICSQPSKPGQAKRRHVVKRADGNIHRELAVCGGCQFRIESGTSLAALERAARNTRLLQQSKRLETHSSAPRQHAPMVGRSQDLFIGRNKIS